MLEGEKAIPPLASASPRLLFDFLPALMSPKTGKKNHTERCRAEKDFLIRLNFSILLIQPRLLR